MENKQETGNVPENTQEGLLFTEQLELAQKLADAVQAKDAFLKSFGGSDAFLALAPIGDNQEKFDACEKAIQDARKDFFVNVVDKKAFLEKLASLGETNLADTVKKVLREEDYR